MQKPTPDAIAAFEAALPVDARVKAGKMFAHPCAFTNGNMFFGTFGETLIFRVGEARATALRAGGARLFEPMEGRPWKEYVQLGADERPAAELARLAAEALTHTVTLPPKAPKPRAAKGVAKAGKAATG